MRLCYPGTSWLRKAFNLSEEGPSCQLRCLTQPLELLHALLLWATQELLVGGTCVQMPSWEHKACHTRTSKCIQTGSEKTGIWISCILPRGRAPSRMKAGSSEANDFDEELDRCSCKTTGGHSGKH